MKLIITFSARDNGNCAEIAKYLSNGNDAIVDFKRLHFHGCIDCSYECLEANPCKYRDDDIYSLYARMSSYDKIVLIVPMYCGNPSSLYFTFNERGQDFFMQNEAAYSRILSRLYIIGIYGSSSENPDFIPTLEKWFDRSAYKNRVLGIERHKLNQKISDTLATDTLKRALDSFIV
ncbi:MAG: flavodoxin family protein [Oscillospiraceae bacterium]|nr:flavodoxin family protein [Oscillospiraceae bacterium]